MKGILSILLCIFLSIECFAQTQQIHLYIVEARTKVPVQDAVVQTKDKSISVISDENGSVALKNTHQPLLISCIGYQSVTINTDSLPSEGPIIVYLETKVSSMAEITVRANARTGIFKTISDLDIHLRPINNSQEVLRLVPGLFIGQHAGGGKAEQIFIRGFDADHGTDINITADGLPVNMVSHAHGQGYADLHFVIPELIDKVNFNKGPYFADKGNFTTAGYVDFKTKNYLEKNFIKLEGGQFNTARIISAINLLPSGKIKRDKSLYIAGEGSFTQGYFDNPQHFNRFNAMAKYHGSLSPSTNITALVSGLKSKWNASGQIPERAVANGTIGFFGAIDNNEGGQTSRVNASIALNSHLPNGIIVNNQAYFVHNEFELYSNFTFFKEDHVNGDQIRQAESRNIAGYTGSIEKDLLIGNAFTHFQSGIQLRYDAVNNLELTRTKNRIINTAQLMLGDVRELNSGVYVNEKWIVNKKLDITGGIRADHFTNQYADKLNFNTLRSASFIISPKLMINYKASEKVQWYIYAGRGFHSNDTRVATLQNGKGVVPPGWGTDWGGIFKPNSKIMVQAAVWYLYLAQEFIYVGDEGVVEPGGKTRRIGLDLSMRWELLKNLYADADLNFSNPRAIGVPKSESYLPLAPRYTSTGGLTYRKQYGLNGSLRYRHMANRPANEDNTVVAKGYFVMDAALNYTSHNWEAGLSIQNLLNTKWKETQFDTESRLQNEPAPVSEIHFTPGTPFFARLSFAYYF